MNPADRIRTARRGRRAHEEADRRDEVGAIDIVGVDYGAQVCNNIIAHEASSSGYTRSIWIDPETHRIMKTGPDGTITPSSAIYAVGAMTRGQIIDASMARSIVQSTSKVANDIIAHLTRRD